VVYVNLFNNQWTTNFRFWNEGTWSSRVRLWAIDRYESAADLIAPSAQSRYPLLAAWADWPAGTLPPSRQGLSVARDGVLATAFGPNPDAAGTILRVWEQAGVSGPCRIQLPEGMKLDSVQPITLRGEPVGNPIAVNDGIVAVELKAFAPMTLLLGSR
jgi:hypothetical protein